MKIHEVFDKCIETAEAIIISSKFSPIVKSF